MVDDKDDAPLKTTVKTRPRKSNAPQREIQLVRVPQSGLYEWKLIKGGGKLPLALTGTYTSINEAEKARDKYNASITAS
jgi:hypothetical protein